MNTIIFVVPDWFLVVLVIGFTVWMVLDFVKTILERRIAKLRKETAALERKAKGKE